MCKGSPVELLPSIDALVGKLNPANSKQADSFVADLTGAYCSALFDNGAEKGSKRANELGRFAALDIQPGAVQDRPVTTPARRPGGAGATRRQRFSSS